MDLYDYHFIIKKLAEEFKGNFDSLGENSEKYITLLASINPLLFSVDIWQPLIL